MINRLMKVVDKAQEMFNETGSFIYVIGCVLVGVALGFGILCFEAWIVSLVWNTIAWNFNLPQFGFWFFVAVITVINMFIPSKKENN